MKTYVCHQPTFTNDNISSEIMNNNVKDIQNNYISVKQKWGLQNITPGNNKKKCGMDEYRSKVLELEQRQKCSFQNKNHLVKQMINLMFFESLLPDFQTLTRTRKMYLKLKVLQTQHV